MGLSRKTSRSRRLVAELVRPGLHLAQASPVGIDESNRACGAGAGAGGVTTAQVALLHFAGLLHVIDGAEWAGNRADFAAYAGGFVNHLGTRGFVNRDGLHRAGMQAPGFIALGAGVGHFFAGLMKLKHLNARLGSGEGAVVLKRTRHLALQAACAFVRVDVQHLLHASLLWVMAPMQCLAYEREYIAIVGRGTGQQPRTNPSRVRLCCANSQNETNPKKQDCARIAV